MKPNDEYLEYYFNQYWACTNPQIFSDNEMRLILLKIWTECWNKFDYEYEGRLSDLGRFYKNRILKGKQP